MAEQPIVIEPSRVDEPHAAREYSEILSQVACQGRPVIIRRNGDDLAAVVPLEHLDLLREVLARQEVEKLAAAIDWNQVIKTHAPAQDWFNGDEPKPFSEERASPW
jgi:hypothetical protein